MPISRLTWSTAAIFAACMMLASMGTAAGAGAKYVGTTAVLLNGGPVFHVQLRQTQPDGSARVLVEADGYWPSTPSDDSAVLASVHAGHEVHYKVVCGGEEAGDEGGVFLGLVGKLWLHADDMVLFQYRYRDGGTPLIYQAGACRHEAVNWHGVSGIHAFKLPAGGDVIIPERSGLVWEITRAQR